MLRIAALALAFSLMASISVAADEKVEFDPVPGFLKVPEGISLGKCSAVAFDSTGRLYLLHRGKTPILCFDADGKYLHGWGGEYQQIPHGIRIDRHDNLWTTDIGSHLVLKYDLHGKLLLSLGTSGKPGSERNQFNKPSDVAFGPKDEVYISDGYINTRVIQFDQLGTFIMEWGQPGEGPGQFNLVHAIKVDSRNHILVADRENERIQVFDATGKVLDIWKGMTPYGIDIDRDGKIFVADTTHHQVLQLDAAGKIVHRWGSQGSAPGQFEAPLMLTCDREGNLYVAEVDGKRLQKFTRRK